MKGDWLRLGLLGAVGCLAGAALAEAVQKRIAPPTVAPVSARDFNPEMQRRLREAGACSGDIQVALMWNDVGSVELVCSDPAGAMLSGANRTLPSGAAVDVVDLGRGIISLHWPAGTATAGRYRVFLSSPQRSASSEPASFVCAVKAGSDVQEFSGAITPGEERRFLYELVYQPSRTASNSLAHLRPGITGALLALGIAIAWLVAYLGQPVAGPTWLTGPAFLAGAALVGLFAGFAGPWLHEQLAPPGPWAPLVAWAAWPIAGGLLGALTRLIHPTLRAGWGLLGGVLGGAAGTGLAASVPFLAASIPVALVAPADRLIGAAGLGMALGLGVALVARPARPSPDVAVNGPVDVPVGVPTGFALRLPTGQSIMLTDGLRLTPADLPGVTGQSLAPTLAEVTRRPDDPSIFGLTNRSSGPWSAQLANGSQATIDPGRTVRLASGTRIDFGGVTAEIL